MLLLPVNRLSQYEFYLKSMLEYMLPNDPERDDYENAAAALAQSSLVVQASWLESGNFASIVKVQQACRSDKGPLDLAHQGRTFIQDFKFKKHYIALFSDSVLIAIKASKPKEFHKVKDILDIGSIT
eukprot:CAMPEP_0206184386 /NCGR_PEP_ID=MMETSP0166-20121206/1188_1 /ASSEMBLY_ACC=CAM_ASM_000260 /TAXON_ID=95228 /ORGANISM="Vannella robusta, Strain DIVA3 518/3/11/1/6" /LENGTH=126 /DNA_ID=CAMNT_0053599393 /DNA_START=280 /DNA_END=657 /DNA_ORIENTATION=-